MTKLLTYQKVLDELEQDANFIAGALTLLKEVDDESTYTAHSAVTGLLNYWVTNNELPCYMQGERIPSKDITGAIVYGADDYGVGIEALQKLWKIDTQELVNKLKSEGFRLPDFLGADAVGESHIKTLTKLVNESPKRLDSCWIAELWAAIPDKIYEQEKPFWLIRDGFKKLMEQAIINDELEATTEERAVGIDDGFKEITEKNRIRKIKNGWLGNNFVNFIITRDDLRKWLISSNQWPLADDCLLAKWFESEPQTEAVGDAGAGNHASNERQNQLHIFIWRVHQVLNEQKKPTAQQLWNEIQHRHETHDTDKIIQEVNGEQILWCSGYGNEQRLQRKTFDKTLSNIRKNPPL